MFGPELLAFLGVSALLTVSPGADMALVARTALAYGQREAFLTTLGICSGLVLHALLWAIGLSALVTQSALAFEVVKLAGAAYLVFLGVRSLLDASKPRQPPDDATTRLRRQVAPTADGRWFWQGLLSNVLNPKVALFYVTFLPQFVQPTDPVLEKSLLLAGIHIVEGLVWLTGYAYLLARVGSALERGGVKRWLERATGAVLIALGLRLAWERR